MKLSIGAVTAVAVLATPLVGVAQDAELSGNVGFASDYFYRGAPQGSSSASAGLDLTAGSFNLGAWAADVAAGNEVDVYLGLSQDIGDLSVSVGGTAYVYTNDAFDSKYLEGNLNAGIGVLSAEFSYGKHDIVATSTGDETYWFVAGTIAQSGLHATYGMFGDGLDSSYIEAGYSLSVGDFDLSAAWIYSDDNADDHALTLGISHTFGIDTN